MWENLRPLQTKIEAMAREAGPPALRPVNLAYPSAIALGAFLLFSVQPMIAKAILPWFGGSASVWITALLFFQVVLLLGYLYAHALTRLRPGVQLVIHLGMLAAAAAMMPIVPEARFKNPAGADPIPRILLLLLATVGLPYFLVSTTGPLVQAWYARATDKPPYRLYALSNLASLLGLLGYPMLIEPWLPIRRQLLGWSAAFAVYAVLCGWICWRNSRLPRRRGKAGAEEPKPGWRSLALWLVCAALPSALLLAVTNHLCQNVAAVPFLWVLPLALYLVTFILCFERPGWYSSRAGYWLLAAGLALMSFGLLRAESVAPLRILAPVFGLGFFLVCLFCHGELVIRRPGSRHVTLFYLTVACGGAVGSLCVGLGAPYLLSGYFELPYALAACGFFALLLQYGKRLAADAAWAGIAVGLFVAAGVERGKLMSNVKASSRNFYGALRIVESPPGTAPALAVRSMVHGVISHGAQFLAAERRGLPTSYYGPDSGAGLALTRLREPGLRAGIIGLGAGTLAVYGRHSDVYRFYEINPQVTAYAHRQFTFLRDCRARVEVVDGDARLRLESEPPNRFDVLVVDAFSGDSIPAHLLTLEAFRLYRRHLSPEGVLALHISNSFLEIAPVVRRLARQLQLSASSLATREDAAKALANSEWIVLAPGRDALRRLGLAAENLETVRPGALWTDDFSNLLGILK